MGLPRAILAAVNVIYSSSSVVDMEMGFCTGTLLWVLLKSLRNIHVLWACQNY